MRKRLFINLLLTLIFSLLATAIVFVIWFNVTDMGFEERQATGILFVLLTIIQNLALVIFTLPVLIQINSSNYLNTWIRISYLFIPPILVTLLFSFYYFTSFDDKIVIAFLIAPLIFCLINSYFYRQLVNKQT